MKQFLLITCSILLAFHSFSFSEGDSTQGSSLQFESFEAVLAKKIVHFKWNIQQEKIGGVFLIEKSIDKIEWKKVSKIESIGSHEDRHTYSFSEINFAEGPEEFFRISYIDEDGKIEVLDIVEIDQPILRNMLLIPIKGKANKEMILSYDSLLSSRGKITIINEEGDIVFLKTIHLIDGYNRLNLTIKNLSSGSYHVFIHDEFDNTISKSLTIYKKRK